MLNKIYLSSVSANLVHCVCRIGLLAVINAVYPCCKSTVKNLKPSVLLKPKIDASLLNKFFAFLKKMKSDVIQF